VRSKKSEHVVGGNGGQGPSFASLCQTCAAVPPQLTFADKHNQSLNMKKRSVSTLSMNLCALIIATTSLHWPSTALNAEDGNDHPLKEFFTSPILPQKEVSEVLTSFEIPNRQPAAVVFQVYHTNLDFTVVGLLVRVTADALDLSYDVIVPVKAEPYLRAEGQAYLFRGEEVMKAEPKFEIKEIRFKPLPAIEKVQSTNRSEQNAAGQSATRSESK